MDYAHYLFQAAHEVRTHGLRTPGMIALLAKLVPLEQDCDFRIFAEALRLGAKAYDLGTWQKASVRTSDEIAWAFWWAAIELVRTENQLQRMVG